MPRPPTGTFIPIPANATLEERLALVESRLVEHGLRLDATGLHRSAPGMPTLLAPSDHILTAAMRDIEATFIPGARYRYWSYRAKHFVEWARRRIFDVDDSYLSHGTFICAAMALGYTYRMDSPTVCRFKLNARQRVLNEIRPGDYPM